MTAVVNMSRFIGIFIFFCIFSVLTWRPCRCWWHKLSENVGHWTVSHKTRRYVTFTNCDKSSFELTKIICVIMARIKWEQTNICVSPATTAVKLDRSSAIPSSLWTRLCWWDDPDGKKEGMQLNFYYVLVTCALVQLVCTILAFNCVREILKCPFLIDILCLHMKLNNR